MMLSKWKIAALTLVALGVIGSGVGVQAQLAGRGGQLVEEADRLKGVEQKLDRLLKALEGQEKHRDNTPTKTTVSSTDYGVNLNYTLSDVKDQPKEVTFAFRQKSVFERLSDVEQRLDRLEQRVEKLVGQLEGTTTRTDVNSIEAKPDTPAKRLAPGGPPSGLPH
jgi:hypothetical protein